MTQRGFSLVEILVAMTILSFMTLLASQAFSFFAQRWDGKIGDFDQIFEDVKVQSLLSRTLEQIVPYVVLNQDDKPRLYFEGNPSGFVAIAQRGITHPEAPAVIRVSAVQNDNFTYDLVFEEWPMAGQTLIRSGKALPFNPPIIIQSDVNDVVFEYFGQQRNLDETTNDDLPQTVAWSNEYNSFVTMRHPRKIKITVLKDASSSVTHIDLIQPTGAITSLITLLEPDDMRWGY